MGVFLHDKKSPKVPINESNAAIAEKNIHQDAKNINRLGSDFGKQANDISKNVKKKVGAGTMDPLLVLDIAEATQAAYLLMVKAKMEMWRARELSQGK